MGSQGCSEFVVQDTAAKLFQTAALLLGNEADAVSLVEDTLAGVEVDPCADGNQAQVLVQDKLVEAAIRRLAQHDPGAFASSGDAAPVNSCIEGDDLSAAGITPEQLEYLLGEGRGQLRSWLEHLPAVQRAVFVERVVLSKDNTTTAGSLNAGGSNWTSDKVSEVFRQALCSLASSLAHLKPAMQTV